MHDSSAAIQLKSVFHHSHINCMCYAGHCIICGQFPFPHAVKGNWSEDIHYIKAQGQHQMISSCVTYTKQTSPTQNERKFQTEVVD